VDPRPWSSRVAEGPSSGTESHEITGKGRTERREPGNSHTEKPRTMGTVTPPIVPHSHITVASGSLNQQEKAFGILQR
jgi:hypothetical protein